MTLGYSVFDTTTTDLMILIDVVTYVHIITSDFIGHKKIYDYAALQVTVTYIRTI